MGQKATLLDAVGDGETARQRPIVLHLTFLTFMELAEDGEKFGGQPRFARIFHGPSRLTVSRSGPRKLHIDPCSVLSISPVSAYAR